MLSLLGNFVVFSILRSWKLTCFVSKCDSATLCSILTFSAFPYISGTARQTLLFKPHHIIFTMYIIIYECMKLSLTLIHCKTLKFQDETYPRTGQKSSLQHSLFEWWSVHFSENIVKVLHSKDAIKLIKSWTFVWWALIWKNQHNVKTVNIVTRIFGRFVG